MENTRDSDSQPIPPMPPVPPTPEDYRDFRENWRNRRQTCMFLGVLVAILVAVIIFVAGIVVGRVSARFVGQRRMSAYGYRQVYTGSGNMSRPSGMPMMHPGSAVPEQGTSAVPPTSTTSNQ